jgi:hypothetical protein
MRISFQSIAHADQIAYTYESDAYSSRPLVSSHFRCFETLGDGMTAHSYCSGEPHG